MSRVTTFSAVLGDLTGQDVDAIVDPTDCTVRAGSHGVNGAVHRRGGPAVQQACVSTFPDGPRSGDAGATTAGDLAARWVIHTVGPDRGRGQRDIARLGSCYRRALQVADELGARSVAFPLLGAGAHGWSRSDALAADAGLMALVERVGMPPVSYADHVDGTRGWGIRKVGGPDLRHPHPPAR